jgi:hypothetical protein
VQEIVKNDDAVDGAIMEEVTLQSNLAPEIDRNPTRFHNEGDEVRKPEFSTSETDEGITLAKNSTIGDVIDQTKKEMGQGKKIIDVSIEPDDYAKKFTLEDVVHGGGDRGRSVADINNIIIETPRVNNDIPNTSTTEYPTFAEGGNELSDDTIVAIGRLVEKTMKGCTFSSDAARSIAEAKVTRYATRYVLSKLEISAIDHESKDKMNNPKEDDKMEIDEEFTTKVKANDDLSNEPTTLINKVVAPRDDDTKAIPIDKNQSITTNTDDVTQLMKESNPKDVRLSFQGDSDDEDESNDDGFGVLQLRPRIRKQRKSNIVASKLIRITIPSHTPKKETSTDARKIDAAVDITEDDVFVEDDPLSFYSTTEGEDACDANSSSMKDLTHDQLTKLQNEQKEDKMKIQAYLSAKLEQSNYNLQKEINQVRLDMLNKQTRQRNQLNEKHHRQLLSDEQKFKEGENLLLQKQKLEMQQMMLSQHGAQQLQSRHAHQRQQFEEGKAEMMKRYEQDIITQNQILNAHHKKRQAEGNMLIQDLTDKYHKQHELLIAKLSMLHEERFKQKRRDIEVQCSVAGAFQSESLARGKVNKSASHLTTSDSKGTVFGNVVSHDSVLRQKQRKGLMNTASIQLAVEIHNEGIIAITRSNQATDNDDRGRSSTFIPWGRSCTSFLYSIVIGEIPSECIMDQICRDGHGMLRGGLVKCMITDLRTSEDIAISERAKTFSQIQRANSNAHKSDMDSIERRLNNALVALKSMQAEYTDVKDKRDKLFAIHNEAVLQLELDCQQLDKFKAQAHNFFEQDGSPSQNIAVENQQKLLTAMLKYKGNYESSKSKETALREHLELSTKAVKTKKSEINTLQKEIVYSRQALASAKGNCDGTTLAVTVEFITASLGKIAEKRRFNRNKFNPEEKSNAIPQKMLRRRITTMLRPSVRMMLGAITAELPTSSSHSKDCFDIVHNDDESSLSPELRAEQLLLLALHPLSTKDPLPSVPVQAQPNQSWAEPGWKIRLDNPSFDRDTSYSILPVRSEGHLSQTMAATCSSCGRQAAALIKPRHLRMLTDPLAFECQTSVPSNSGYETKLSQAVVDADPLSATDDKCRLGYNFVYRPEMSDVVEKATKDAKNNNKRQRAPKVTTTATPKAQNKRKQTPTKKQKIEALASDLAKASDQPMIHSPDHHSQQIPPSHPPHQSIIGESHLPSQQTYRPQFQFQHQQQSQSHVMTLPQRSPSQQNLQFQQQQQQNMAAMRQLQQQYQVNPQQMQSNPMQFMHMLQHPVPGSIVPGSISIVTSHPDLQPQNKKSA